MMELITRNWLLKLISLLLAVGLWYYAVGEEGIEVTRSVPLKIEVKNSQLSLLERSVDRVQVTFLAPRALVSNLASEEITAVHKIGEEARSAGEYSFRLESREIKLPDPQIRILNIEPEVIEVVLDELIVQKLPVKPNFLGEPAIGFKVHEEETQVDPNAILLEGPKGQLAALSFVHTEYIDLVGRIRSVRRSVGLELPPNVKPLSEVIIDVYIPIREEFAEKGFENIPVKVLRPFDGEERIEVTPPQITFTLKGSVRQLEKVSPENLVTYIDISALENGEHLVPVQMILPEDVSLKEDEPVSVKVNIKKK